MSEPLIPQDGLFAEFEPVEKLSAGRRLTLRQRADVEHRRHPLTRGRLTDVDGATCGSCVFRILESHHARSYPKCHYGGRPFVRVTSSVVSDVRAWWPGCVDWKARELRDD
jgi:hypothetical protein